MGNMSLGNLNIKTILLDANKSVKDISIGPIVIWKTDYLTKPLTLKNISSESTTIELCAVGTPPYSDVAYSTDGTNWTTFTPAAQGTNQVTVAVGDSVQFRATMTGDDVGGENYLRFFMSGSYIEAYGNVMSMFYGSNFEDQKALPYKYCGNRLFMQCEPLKNIDNLKLPATELKQDCYYRMFYHCYNLTTIPAELLPAVTLPMHSYANMFEECLNLQKACKLPNTNLISCCERMFNNCSSLHIDTTQGTHNYAWTPGSILNGAKNMFSGTGGSFKGTPKSNTTYYWDIDE